MHPFQNQIISTLLGTLLISTSNWLWAEEPDQLSGVIPPACQAVRATYKAERQAINQSCLDELEVRTQAQQYCSENGLWNPYCHTPCDQTPPTTGGPKDVAGHQAHADLCLAEQALEECRAQKAVDLEEHQLVVNEICCPFWPCTCTSASIVGTWAIGLDLDCDGITDVNRTAVYHQNLTWNGVGFPNGGPWSQQKCNLTALDNFFSPPIIWTAKADKVDGNSLSNGTFSGIFNGCWTATRISTPSVDIPVDSINFYGE
jgi:hypothetical protein